MKVKARLWYGKFFTSQEDLNEAFIKGVIGRKVIQRTYGSDYYFATPNGEVITSFYKKNNSAMSTEAHGVELPFHMVVDNKNVFERNY